MKSVSGRLRFPRLQAGLEGYRWILQDTTAGEVE